MAAQIVEDLLKAERIRVFLPDEELVWITAEIIKETRPGSYEIEINDPDYKPTPQAPAHRIITMRSLCRQLDELPLQNDGLNDSGVNDMCMLNYLHEASILDNLRRRFTSFLPYTYTGDICIAVNPYRWLDIYKDEVGEQYAKYLRHELPPHVYSTSAAAYKGLRDYNRNQSILVSGESGAGKTETVKILMGHIAHISGKRNDKTIDKVLKANPLLESFGNAKTARNDNSSRFGKFTQLQFDRFSMLAGSRCVTYLLEKSRVVTQSSLERNYHVFHQIFQAPDEWKELLQLKGTHPSQFNYTMRGDLTTTTIEGIPDGEKFSHNIQVLELLGLETRDIQLLFRILAGIMYLGQISYIGDADSSTLDPKYEKFSNICCNLLEIDIKEFAIKTTTRSIEVAGKEMTVHLSKDQANDGRDALAKDMYDRLFLWLVGVINDSTSAPNSHDLADRTIALLDIFGFESFAVNRFEQLCINYANEKLQQKFTQDVFQAVQAEYREEGLRWELISYKDNAEVIDLLEGRLGILALLNEECLMPQGSDSKYLAKITTSCKSHPCFSLSVYTSKDEFSIHHYARKVSYNCVGFVERNRDTLPTETRALMLTSKNSILVQIYASLDPSVGADAMLGGETNRMSMGGARRHSSHGGVQRRQSFMKADTVTTKFRAQLTRLMETIGMTDVQYIRCIKPNANKSDLIFDRSMVVEQLRCAGMIEAIRISRAAYPYRVPHVDFLARFSTLRSKYWMSKQGVSTPDDMCRVLLKELIGEQAVPPAGSKPSAHQSHKLLYELGRTRVYFSAGVLETLENLRGGQIFRHIGSIQRVYRGTRMRRRYLLIRRKILMLQRFSRCHVARLKYQKLRKSVILAQKMSRGWSARRLVRYLRQQYAIFSLQSWVRMVPHRIRFKRLRRAASVVGSWMKMKVQRKKYLIKIVEARENAKLSNQLEKLKARLQEEAQAREMERELAEAARTAAEAELEKRREALLQEAEAEREKMRAEMLAEQQQRLLELMELQKSQAAAATMPPSGGSNSESNNRTIQRGIEELEALEHLQQDLEKLRAKNELLARENADLKLELRKGSSTADIKSGELAVSRVHVESLEKERDALRVEKESHLRQIKSLKADKQHMVSTIVNLHSEQDNLSYACEREQLLREREHDLRMLQLNTTIDFLTVRGLDKSIIQELQNLITNIDNEGDDMEGEDRGSLYGRGSISGMRGGGSLIERKRSNSRAANDSNKRSSGRRRKQSISSAVDREDATSQISSVSTHHQRQLQVQNANSKDAARPGSTSGAASNGNNNNQSNQGNNCSNSSNSNSKVRLSLPGDIRKNGSATSDIDEVQTNAAAVKSTASRAASASSKQTSGNASKPANKPKKVKPQQQQQKQDSGWFFGIF